MRASRKNQGRTAASIISARLSSHITLGVQADGGLAASFDSYSIGLGKFSAGAIDRAQNLRAGLPLGSLMSDGPTVDVEIDRLVRRLAKHGFLEYGLRPSPDGNDQVVIEPQVPDYWPQAAELGDAETIALSRFAYLRRRGHEMVLESPRAGALFRICDPKVAAALTLLAKPQQVSRLRRQDCFPGHELLALLLDCQILFRIAGGEGLRADEGDTNLVLWDFHDLLFHTRSTEGRQANPLGGLYAHAGVIDPPPAVRPRWPGEAIELSKFSNEPAETSAVAKLLRERHSTREFDEQQPITLAELSRFLDRSARIHSKWKSRLDDFSDDSPDIEYAAKPYPSAGSAYELELYLAVANCAGLARGFYHYDADQHALVSIGVGPHELEALLKTAEFAMDAPAAPQILFTIAARFDRIAWKYSSIAYALILKDVGVLLQTFYLMATDMGLGGCAIGTNNIDLFARMTGIDFHIEGPVGQFAIGRGRKPDAPD